ncbi:hypothetical protein KIN20_004003 [Parelaphostrongylus tenuis]|uniref:Uncharacterized protein n=1 Tax=Parelaphostrongylus tenuis TaxID=148309 RepID=A0AAD5MGK9_PARTN|nr:hypothetical protein KIN20_004003 [Parelaphostrongylus tenuis]
MNGRDFQCSYRGKGPHTSKTVTMSYDSKCQDRKGNPINQGFKFKRKGLQYRCGKDGAVL